MVFSGIPVRSVKGDVATILMRDSSSVADDEIRIATVEINYPRIFNFENDSLFAFILNSSAVNGRLLKITNFNKGTSLPVLYDAANNLRYTGDTSVAGTIRFLLKPSSVAYDLFLIRGDGSTATAVTALTKRNFINYNAKANQGNYLIISNPLIYGSGSGNYVEQYRAYRASAAGGNFNSKTIDINEINDQFAFGIKTHPLAVKEFLQYARKNFTTIPAYVFIIGKGITYDAYRINAGSALDDEENLVQTWGSPGSDNLLGSKDYSAIPETPIGRLSAVTPQEVAVYFNKVKQYESAQQDSVQNVAAKGWMKNVLHVVGADDEQTGLILDRYMNAYKKIITDTLFGANVTTFSKTLDPSGYPGQLTSFKNIFDSGSSVVSYFGHSSSTRLDFNLDNPSQYNNVGKYPVFIVNGCLAGNIFDYDDNRLNSPSTISEKFVLSANSGAIGYLAATSYGISTYLNIYTKRFYQAITNTQYGQGFGLIMQTGIRSGLNFTGLQDFYGRLQAEQYAFNGDPAIKINSFAKPDYTIDSTDFIISPSYISISDSVVKVKIYVHNIGRATGDSVHFSVTQQYASGLKAVVFAKWFSTLKIEDSVSFTLPVIPDRDKGLNKLIATIDDMHTIDELNENNNTASKNFIISSSDLLPVYPYNYSIVSGSNTYLYASTADPLANISGYIGEADTTALFNSPIKTSFGVISTGGSLRMGLLQLPFDNKVYYWRVTKNDSVKHWNNFSFLHNSSGAPGFAQAHFYQFTQSTLNGIVPDSSTRNFSFGKELTNVFVNQAIYPTSGENDADFSVSVNGTFISQSACVGSSVIFNVFDSLLFKPWVNTANIFGAAAPCAPDKAINFEYSTLSANWRDSAVKFFDSIPNGAYVIAREIYNIGDNDWAPTVWAGDTALYGHNNSLYNRLKLQGVPVDSFYYPRTFVFLFRKNDAAHFTPLSALTQGLYDNITLSDNIITSDTIGYVTSPTFGPAYNWNTLVWNGYASDASDVQSLQVIGQRTDGSQRVLYTLNGSQKTFDISGVNANSFPYMKLQLKTQDSIKAIPFQLQNWSVTYTPSSETAIAPNFGLNIADTFNYYHAPNAKFDTLAGFVAFKNVSNINVDSFKAMVVITDASNKADTFILPHTKAMLQGDTVHVSFILNAEHLQAGKYNFYITILPANKKTYDQYLFNNFLYKYIVINRTLKAGSAITFHAQPSAFDVQGNWIVRNNAAVNNYELQRSTDNINFISIGNLPQLSTEQTNFNLADKQPVTGKNYYRIKAINKDNTISYSATKEVDFNVKSDVQVYPNPFTKTLNISLKNEGNKNVVVKIINARGQVVFQQSFSSAAMQIDGSQFASGSYIIVTDDGTEQKTFKVQKQ